ncbi:hypothetical protein Tco_0566611 [Tanacetum coccineum]
MLTLKPLPKIDPKDKGKKMIDEECESNIESDDITEAKKKFKMLAKDEEVARKVQEEWEAEEGKKRLAEEEATKVSLTNEYDFIQARINADKILAEELQKEEREKFTIEQRAKFLHDTIAAQRKFLAQQRSEAIRNKPPTRNQLRNQMMTYLKHVGGKKHSDLKTKTFEEIQVLYEILKRQDQNFIAIGSAKDESQIKELNKDPKKKMVFKETLRKEDTTKVHAKQEVTEKGTKKRKSGHVKMLARKRPRPLPDDDSDNEHRKCIRIITFDSTIDSEILETKSFIARLHKVSSPDGNYLIVYKVNGHVRAFNYLMENNQQEWEIVIWRLYEACRVFILELKDGTVSCMLVERKYPLFKELLQQMLDLGLEVEVESTVAQQLNYLKEQTLCKLKMAEQDIPPPTITAMKIPIIRKGEYDIWSMRMRQYICHTDHNLWDVIVNGDLEEEPAPTGETSAPPAPKTAKQLAAKRNQERVKSILLLAIPDEYLLKFHNVADAKSLWEAIKSRFGGNEESKKMQKNVLKHQFEKRKPFLSNQTSRAAQLGSSVIFRKLFLA